MPNTPGLRRFAAACAAAAYVLVCAGALVTSTGSSLAVPDWPLSFGKMMPPLVGGVLFEHGHRLIAGIVALSTCLLVGWAWRARAPRPVRLLAAAAAGGILIQAVLGGATVLLRLPPAVSIAHACLGQAVFCLLLACAQASTPWYRRAAPAGEFRWTAIGGWVVAAVFLQLLLGARLRHTGEGLALHVGWAAAAASGLLTLAGKGLAGRQAALRGPSTALAGLAPLQLALGYASYRVRFSPDFEAGLHWSTAATAAHVAVGAALLGGSILWTMRVRRAA